MAEVIAKLRGNRKVRRRQLKNIESEVMDILKKDKKDEDDSIKIVTKEF